MDMLCKISGWTRDYRLLSITKWKTQYITGVIALLAYSLHKTQKRPHEV